MGERLLSSIDQLSAPKGVSLKRLVVLDSVEHKRYHSATVNKINWLSDAVETTDFWDKLRLHLLNDNKVRHSVGGLFYRERGKERIGDYSWSEAYSSLDHFLKGFGSRATEFLFRDFHPQQNNSILLRKIQETRTTALDKFPRLRRLYWDDYKEVLETVRFWTGMVDDLERLDQPTSVNRFFNHGQITLENKSNLPSIKTNLERGMVIRFIHQVGQLEQRAQLLDYRNMSQIIEDMFSQDPRNFFLQYQSESKDLSMQRIISYAKKLIEQKIIPLQLLEKLKRINIKDLRQIVKKGVFWQDFLRDLNQHVLSKKPVYDLSYFLRHYDRDANEVIPNRIGTYTNLCTAFSRKTKGASNRLIKKPSGNLVRYLMWKAPAPAGFEKTMSDVKQLTTELFPQDCLYVALQTSVFWGRFEEDIQHLRGKPSFQMFLRYFSRNNPTASRLIHKRGDSYYQRLIHRSYHEPKDLQAICKYLKLPISKDYKTNLQTLFFHTAPPHLKQLLRQTFPTDFDTEAKQNKVKERIIFDATKERLKPLSKGKCDSVAFPFNNTEELVKLRSKIQTAAKSLNLTIKTSKPDSKTLIVERRGKKKHNSKEMLEVEEKVKKLRDQGLKIKEIAFQLDIDYWTVEYAVTKLIRKKKINPKIIFTRKRA